MEKSKIIICKALVCREYKLKTMRIFKWILILLTLLNFGCDASQKSKPEELKIVPCTVDKISGYKNIKLGANRLIYLKDIEKLQNQNLYKYTADCNDCKSVFNQPVSDIYLRFGDDYLLNSIVVSLENKLNDNQEKELLSDIILAFGDPTDKGMSGTEDGFGFYYEWCGNNICVVLLEKYSNESKKYDCTLGYSTPQYNSDY